MKITVSIIQIILISTICLGQDAARQIEKVANEIDKQLTTLKVADDLKQQCTNDVADARANLKQGRLYLGLYTLRSCQLELASLAYTEANADLASKGAEAFEAKWRELGTVLSEKEKTLTVEPPKPLPAVITGIADSTRIQARPYYQSGRLFALNSNLTEGLYYTARAPADLDFAILCRTLRFPKLKGTLDVRSVEPELKKLETTALRTYKSADVSNQQGQYNRLNSSLKVASELNAASMFEGALLKYLESKLAFGVLIATAEREDIPHLQARSKEVAKLLSSEKMDHSIGLLFSEMAEAALSPAGSAEPSPGQVKRAVVILDIVLPAYFDYVKETRQ